MSTFGSGKLFGIGSNEIVGGCNELFVTRLIGDDSNDVIG